MSIDDIVEMAHRLSNEGHTAEAEAWYQKAAEAGDVASMAYLGSQHHTRGETTEAERWYLAAAAKGHVDSVINLATLRAQQNEFPEAERLFRTVADSPDAMVYFANFLAGRERLEEAVELFQTAISKLNTPSARAHLELGDVLRRLDQLEEAIVEFRTASNLRDPNYSRQALRGEAEALEALERNAEAEELYRALLNDEDEGLAIEARIGLGALLFSVDRFVESESVYLTAVDAGNSADSKIALHDLGIVYLIQGDLEKAEQALRRTITDRDDTENRLALAGVLLAANKPHDAEAVLDEVIDFGESEKGARAWLVLASVLYMKDKFEQAEIAYRRAINVAGGDILAAAYLGLGATLHSRDDVLSARDAFRKAIELGSSDVATSAIEALADLDEED
jgi:tetratricopeptide (TPR) repeat protein